MTHESQRVALAVAQIRSQEFVDAARLIERLRNGASGVTGSQFVELAAASFAMGHINLTRNCLESLASTSNTDVESLEAGLEIARKAGLETLEIRLAKSLLENGCTSEDVLGVLFGNVGSVDPKLLLRAIDKLEPKARVDALNRFADRKELLGDRLAGVSLAFAEARSLPALLALVLDKSLDEGTFFERSLDQLSALDDVDTSIGLQLINHRSPQLAGDMITGFCEGLGDATPVSQLEEATKAAAVVSNDDLFLFLLDACQNRGAELDLLALLPLRLRAGRPISASVQRKLVVCLAENWSDPGKCQRVLDVLPRMLEQETSAETARTEADTEMLAVPARDVIRASFARARQDWEAVRRSIVPVTPDAAAGYEDYVRNLRQCSLVTSWQGYKSKAIDSIVERTTDRSEFGRLAPPSNEEVLVLNERDADPGAFLSMHRTGRTVFASMDSLDSRLAQGNRIEYWSLRDLLPDTDPVTGQMYLDVKRISETLIGRMFDAKIRRNLAMGPERFRRVLAVGLEDALMGQIISAGCFIRALEQFEGKHVVITQRSGDIFRLFRASFERFSDKTFYFTHSGPIVRKAHKQLSAIARGMTPEPKAADLQSVCDVVDGLDDTSCGDLLNAIPDVRRPSVGFIGFFNDPIYIGNIVPLLRTMLEKFDVYILEANSSGPTWEALKAHIPEHIDPQDEATNRIVFVNLADASSAALADPRLAPANFEHLSSMLVEVLDPYHDLNTGGLTLDSLLSDRLPGLLRSVTARCQISINFMTEFFRRFELRALYACSERMPMHMAAIEVANSFDLPTVDVMAVNSIRLPRYKAPAAKFCTSIDTLTAEFFEDFFGLEESRIVLSGSPRLDSMLNNYDRADPQDILARLAIPDGVPIALIASQLQPIERCLSILKQVLEAQVRNPNLYSIVKLHRRESSVRESIYRDAIAASGLQERVRIVRSEPVLKDIENCLRVSTVVVSMYSNVLREAACCGIPIVIADYFDGELPFEYVSSGIGVAAKSPEALTQIVCNFVENAIDPVYAYRNQLYFDRNPQLLSRDSAQRIVDIVG